MRANLLRMLVAVAGLVYVSTELLSIFDVITPFSIRSFWAFGFTLFMLWLNTQQRRQLKNRWQNTITSFRRLPYAYQYLVLAALLMVVTPLLFLAIYTPPNNVDSISYHLSRVIYWLQNQNVAHFPTSHVQQLYHNVMSEYLLLHVMALSDGADYFVNLIQWGAMLGSVCAVTLIAQLSGLSTKTQVIVGLLLLTLPIGLLEATTTQNDYVALFFFLSFVYFGLWLTQQFRWEHVVWMSVSLALGGFTKYPIFFFAFPYSIWFGVQILQKYGFRPATGTFIIALTTLLMVFGPFWMRNYTFFGNIFSPRFGTPLFIENIAAEEYGVAQTASNIAKNIGLHLGLPAAGYNTMIDYLMKEIHQMIGIPINNPKTSLDAYRTQFVIQEDISGNFLLLSAMFMASVWLLFQKKQWVFKGVLICALVGFILFCSLVKFQLWSSRTQMPFFAQGVLLIGLMMTYWRDKIKILAGVLLLATSIPYIISNYNKPIVPIRYIAKYWLGYVPRHLCIPDEVSDLSYRQALNDWYDFDKKEPCSPLKVLPYYDERQQIFAKLDSLGYYNNENDHIFRHTRDMLYFLCDADYPQSYLDFNALCRYIDPSANIGLMFVNHAGFSHYWSILNKQQNPGWQMRYVFFHKEYLALPNAGRIFAYQYILADTPQYIHQYIAADNIEAIYKTKTMLLIRLKRPISQYFTY